MSKFIGTTLPDEVNDKITNMHIPDCLTHAEKVRRLVVMGLEHTREK